MKLYNGRFAPNARRVRIFLAEKGLSVPMVDIDLAKMEQRSPSYTALNPFQRVPTLELDDGTVITESIAICRYLEELNPAPPLFGANALERAMVEMWQRRLELMLLFPVAQAFRHSHPAMKDMETPQVAPWAEASKGHAIEAMAVIDEALRGREFIASDRFTVADITGLVALDFAKPARIAIPEQFANLTRWRDALAARPSAQA
ncbi:MAG TPA: glutathione S-transferase [Roseiarcus sp.]|jgi:glutathione S-transferase